MFGRKMILGGALCFSAFCMVNGFAEEAAECGDCSAEEKTECVDCQAEVASVDCPAEVESVDCQAEVASVDCLADEQATNEEPTEEVAE